MHIQIHRGRALARLATIALAAVLVVACSGGGGGITTSGAWARNAPKTAGAGAAYLVITNTGSSADALVAARSDVASTVEVHETYELEAASMPAESPAMGGMESPAASMSTSPMMGMRPITRLEIPAGGTVELKPGGYHIMLIQLVRELKVGDTVEIILTFEQAGDVTVTAEVREG